MQYTWSLKEQKITTKFKRLSLKLTLLVDVETLLQFDVLESSSKLHMFEFEEHFNNYNNHQL
jgi:hypothetical protein